MRFSLSQIAVAVFTLITAAIAATWYLRGEQIEVLKQQIATYEVGKKINLGELAKEATQASVLLSEQLAKSKFAMELDKLNADLQIELDELRKEVEEKNQKISDFESNMETLFLHHESFYLEDGELKKLFGADHIFSVTHVSYDVIHTIFNNKRILLGLGEYITFQQNGNRCRLLLEKANPNNGGYFSVLCDK